MPGQTISSTCSTASSLLTDPSWAGWTSKGTGGDPGGDPAVRHMPWMSMPATCEVMGLWVTR